MRDKRDEDVEAASREIGLAERKFAKAAARLDRQSARLLAKVSTRDDDHSLMYRMHVEADVAEAVRREHAFDVHRYSHEVRMLWAVLTFVLSAMVAGLGFSVWLIVNGREESGNPILSAIVSGALSYLAGVGTPRGLLRRGVSGSDRGG
jgi:hypothetical protein